MSSRALSKAANGAREIDMSPNAPVVTSPSDSARLMAAYKAGQAGAPWPNNDPAGNWFGPGIPLAPIAPPEVAGRTWDFPAGYNFQNVPRPYEPVTTQELRALAKNLDILATVITTRKDQMEKLNWSIVGKTLPDGTPAGTPNKTAIKEITTLLERPDGDHDWGPWLRILLEDLFVIDAPTVYCRRTFGNQLIALDILDGAGIKRIIDEWGRTPEPPIPAYQHILHGVPAVDYTTDDIIWMPRNLASYRSFGRSPTEDILTTINIAIRKQLFMLDWFTEGSVPSSLIGTPDDWTADQIAKFQKYWDDMLSGNLEQRRHAMFVPGGVAKTFITTKEPDLTGKTDEWLARVVCFAFSISPQPFISMMNRATAESAHEAALSEGLYPVMNWTKRLIDRVIQRFWPDSNLEFKWADDTQVDKTEQEGIITGYVSKGVMTINEGRDILGLDPVPEGDKIRALTGTGYVNIDTNDDAPTAGEQAQSKQDQAKAQAEALASQKTQAPAPASNGQPPAPKEAPAGKAAGTFRKGSIRSKEYWQAKSPRPKDRSHPPHQGGDRR